LPTEDPQIWGGHHARFSHSDLLAPIICAPSVSQYKANGHESIFTHTHTHTLSLCTGISKLLQINQIVQLNDSDCDPLKCYKGTPSCFVQNACNSMSAAVRASGNIKLTAFITS